MHDVTNSRYPRSVGRRTGQAIFSKFTPKMCAPLLGGALLALAVALPATAADKLLLDEITVRGEKESPKEESLSVREVRESPARDMGEALRYVEGIDYIRKGAIANDVVLRGLQRDNINVLIDGVRLHGACPNRMDSPTSHYDFAEIEQVKIIKGPYDLSNPGSMGGVIDAISKKPRAGFGSDVSLTVGSYDSVNASAILSYGADLYDGLLGYAHKSSDVPRSGDGKLITEIYPSNSNNRYRPDAIRSEAYEINTGWLKLGVNPTDNSRSELSYSYQDADHVLYPYLLMDANYDRTNRLNWTYRITNVTPVVRDLKLQFYWDNVRHLMDDRLRETSDPANAAFPPARQAALNGQYSMATMAKSYVIGSKLGGDLAVGPGTLHTGVDYYNRNWDAVNNMLMQNPISLAWMYGNTNMIPDVNIDNFGLYADYDWRLRDDLTLRGGVRGDFTWTRANNSNVITLAKGGSSDYQEVSANLQLTYAPAVGLEIFTGLGRGVRTPDPQELYQYLRNSQGIRQGDPTLSPTVNHQADLGVKYTADRFTGNASLFYSDLTDYINYYGYKNGGGVNVRSYQNVHATLWGAEFGSQLSLPLDLYLKGSLSYVEGKNLSGDRPLAEIPPLRGTVALRYDVDTWFAELAEHMAARQDRVDGSLQEIPTGGWAITDFKAGFKYQSFTLMGGVNNLFDKFYYNYLSYSRDPFSSGLKVPENGRNFYVTASYKF